MLTGKTFSEIMIGALVLAFLAMFFWQEGTCSKNKARLAQNGMWGSEHIALSLDKNGASLEYDCAHGTIGESMKLDTKGRFDVTGRHIREHGGPIVRGEKSDNHPAHYTGQVNGEKMVITITLTDTHETVGTYTVVYGQQPKLFKCK
jgi:hypothetical protein